MFAHTMRPMWPRVTPSLAQNEWFPQTAQDELKELDALEKALEAEHDMIRNMVAPQPMGRKDTGGGARAQVEEEEEEEEEGDEVEIDEEADDASLEDSIDFDGSVDTVDLDADEAM